MNAKESAAPVPPVAEGDAPLVSVCVITYNHGKYIRQCLDGILMQKVNFPYEILIHDASPDDTADIIREYESKYPDVIKPIYQTVNQYSQGLPVSKWNYDRARGKYIALCEGDDYWTDPGKLQMQVDFLEEHEEYVGTAHNVRVVDEKGLQLLHNDPTITYHNDHRFTFHSLEAGKWIPGQTASLVYKNIYRELTEKQIVTYFSTKANGDRKLAALLVCFGDLFCFGNAMSCYRKVINAGTSWSRRNRNINLTDHHCQTLLSLERMINSISGRIINMDYSYLCVLDYSLLYLCRQPNPDNFNILISLIKSKRIIFVKIPPHVFIEINTYGIKHTINALMKRAN